MTALAMREGPAEPHGEAPARVLVVDDSLVVRRVIAKVLADDRRFEIVGAVSSAAQALAFVAANPVDLVLLDVEMAGESGLTVLPRLLEHDRRLRVVILSGSFLEGSEAAVRALAIGASDVVAKPTAGHFSNEFIDSLIERLLQLAPAGPRGRLMVEAASARNWALRPMGGQIRALAIGASTGGIGAIISVLSGLPEHIDFPIFITQHLPPNFQTLFASQIAKSVRFPVVVASDELIVRSGVIHVATGEAHLTVQRRYKGLVRIVHSHEATGHGTYPAVDPMFRSLGTAYGPGGCGIILSGMGRDGLVGARALVDAGGWMIAQDGESSAVWGMPGSVARAGLASIVQAPDAIASAIAAHMDAAA